ncbi:selenide, water dikinase SelD [Sedimentitalea sp. JM2-8]|uniref:Selenide, water dikinase SelD n=1 Tax=Sedimentitalea xiamensis TaxID=3050037 RepID=A0ABT7FIL8_9RHOB|nr:selenide, water dikinase SelD [Sedimentitalea xiamensis]MDK3074880.1 selenide, water dikinase SelD [Sedimentitalea xiamensis]
MDTRDLPLTHDLVLIGGGHTHALVLRRWGMRPMPGARVTVINPGPTAPYSGMLPGFVAGHYRREQLDIDLIRLARFAGARIIVGAADGIDRENRVIHVPGRPPIAYDVCSVDIGITSDMPELAGFSDHAIPAKPLGPFSARWAAFLKETGPAQVAILGGGVAGAELVMAMAHALKTAGRQAETTLIEKAGALSALGGTARKRILSQMAGLGVRVLEGVEVSEIRAGEVVLANGTQIASGFTTGAAGARAYGWLGDTGLDLQDGFIRVGDTLQSSDPAIFAVGDCAHMTGSPRPKAGVYAVRQAPVLYDNLCAVLAEGGMRRYRPQADYLKLISLGGKSALGERFGLTLSGPLMWRWKDHIDGRFMRRFQDLPAMQGPELPPVHTTGLDKALGDKPMCGGCGAKVGRSALRRAIAWQPSGHRPDITPLPGDDAALLLTGGARQVMTSDHLRAFVEDPVAMTRIAAVHALGDIWAMGATPQAATASIILPRLSDALQERTLREIMQSAHAAMQAAGAEIVGGHSSVGSELTIGFTLTGLCERAPITLAGARPDDALILTKPLGSGVLMAADMAGLAKGRWIVAAIEQMSGMQTEAAAILSEAHAMTDVTGFGLAGHLHGMCDASGTGALLDLAAVPVMPGAEEMSEAGVRSSLFAENRSLVPTLPDGGKAALLFDPQTAGGLLAAVEPSQADDLLSRLRAAGYPAARIGSMTGQPGQLSLSAG